MNPPDFKSISRRRFVQKASRAIPATMLALHGAHSGVRAQEPGERPKQATGIEVLNPRARVPVGLIIDDSTCLVNLNRFAMPQFNAAWDGKNKSQSSGLEKLAG